jgi:hypothetical protein
LGNSTKTVSPKPRDSTSAASFRARITSLTDHEFEDALAIAYLNDNAKWADENEDVWISAVQNPAGLLNGLCAFNMVAGARNHHYLQLWRLAA